MTKQDMMELLGQGYDCGQIVLLSAAPKLGLTREQALALTAGFGGGMLAGETCGAVVGALIAIGCKNGAWQPGDQAAKGAVMEQITTFRARFAEKNGSCLCRELLGYSVGIPEEAQKIGELGLTQKICPGVIWSSVELLEEFLE